MRPSKTRRQHPLAWAAALVLTALLLVVIAAPELMRTADGDDPPVQPPRKDAPRRSPEELVARLWRLPSGTPADKARGDAVVAHGEAALPALEKALRLGLRGRESQAFIDSGTSRRWAVVAVLDRIPGERSTDLLVRALADHPDTFGMRHLNLRAVEKRDLSTEHLKALLAENPYPKPVLLALRKIGTAPSGHELRPLVERIHDPAVAKKQLRNEYDYPNARPRDLWEIRLRSGQVLGKDMFPEIRQRARSLVKELLALVNDRGPFGARPERDAVRWERMVAGLLFALRDLGASVQATVRESAGDVSGGTEEALLDMARLLVGETERVDAVAQTLTTSQDARLRHCAMITLAEVKVPRSKPALWKALHDPLSRENPSSFRVPGRDDRVYPIRERAARTLIEMGVDEAEVRRRSPKKDAK